MKFSSSGREDVDVRCLGRGRPFVVEFLNPRKTDVSVQEILKCQQKVNEGTNLISIRDLQLVSK